MKKRVNELKFRTSSKSFSLKPSQFDLQPEKIVNKTQKIIEPENDNSMTNFWPVKPSLNTTSITGKMSEKEFLF